jgi:ribosomal protein S6
MFLVDSADAASDWDGVVATVRTILDRAGAEVLSLKKWDERKLAYEINRKSRGTYILSYFRAVGTKIQGMERDIRLNERIMRALILNVEHMTQEDIDKPTPSELIAQGLLKRDEEGDRDRDRDERPQYRRRPPVRDFVEDIAAEPEAETAKETAGEEEEGEAVE